MEKQLYHLKANVSGEIHNIYRWAFTRAQGFELCLRALAEKLGRRSTGRLVKQLNDGPRRYEFGEHKPKEKADDTKRD